MYFQIVSYIQSVLRYNRSMKLKISVFNIENLFIFMDKYKGQDISKCDEADWQLFNSSLKINKSLEKTTALAKAFLEIDADIFMLTEVGGAESLENFNKYFLNESYVVKHLSSNSDRGIDLAYLVKKELDLSFELQSNKKFKLKARRFFSRDVLELHISKDKNKRLILFLVHLKSKLDMKKVDHEGRSQRLAEVEGLVKLFQKRKKIHDIPILIGGDFNGIIDEEEVEPEFAPLFKHTNLKDVCSLFDMTVQERCSYPYFHRNGDLYLNQIDYLFIEKKLKHLIATPPYMYRFKNDYGDNLGLPETLKEKRKQPSDHFPLVCELNIDF